MDLPLFSDEVPIFEARGSIMFIRRDGLTIAMPISRCGEYLARFNRELDRWHESCCEVVRLPPPH